MYELLYITNLTQVNNMQYLLFIMGNFSNDFVFDALRNEAKNQIKKTSVGTAN